MSPPEEANTHEEGSRPVEVSPSIRDQRIENHTDTTEAVLATTKDVSANTQQPPEAEAEQSSGIEPSGNSDNEKPSAEIPEPPKSPGQAASTLPQSPVDAPQALEGDIKTSDASDQSEAVAAQLEQTRISAGPENESLEERERQESQAPPPPPPKDEKYLSAAGTQGPKPPSAPTFLQIEGHSVDRRPSEAYFDEKADDGNPSADGKEKDADSRSEIQSIMGQFDEGMGGAGMEEIMSPRLEFAGSALGQPVVHPPRTTSLDPIQPGVSPTDPPEASPTQRQVLTSPPPRTSSLPSAAPTGSSSAASDPEKGSSSKPASTIFKPPPLTPDPEPDLPFDFHRFLEQLRHRTADPVAKFLRSFLLEFGKKQWMVHEQVKIISDFLEFISKKMAQCEVWRTVSDAEFDNAREGMEKLVMNRLYTQTFSPAIPPPEPVSMKGRKKAAHQPPGPRRRGQHQEDVERDEVLAQKVQIYGWVNEDHLDIKPLGDKGRKFLSLAQKELLKIKSYRAPRDKVICVLNCCKVIFGYLRNVESDQSADSFVPLLIYTVIHANPEHLVSNVQYILRFRNQDKLGGEAGYYISSLMGAVQFIENIDRTSLTITDEEFEKNVEAAVSAIAERHSSEEDRQQLHLRHPSPKPTMHIPEKSTISRPEITPRNSLEAERVTPGRKRSLRNGTSTDETEGNGEENAAVAGLLRSIQRPLSTIGRIFNDDDNPSSQPTLAQQQLRPGNPASTPQPGSTPRHSPAPHQETQRHSLEEKRRSAEQAQHLSAEDAAARQASAEAEEARKIQRQEHRVVVETLAGMFPNLDREVIDDVVRVKEGRVGLAVDACLALTN